MKKAVALLAWTILGIIGFSVGMAGKVMGWIFLLAAVWSIVATIRAQDDGKEDQASSGIWFDVGGCGG